MNTILQDLVITVTASECPIRPLREAMPDDSLDWVQVVRLHTTCWPPEQPLNMYRSLDSSNPVSVLSELLRHGVGPSRGHVRFGVNTVDDGTFDDYDRVA
jgi:hypothetical protein